MPLSKLTINTQPQKGSQLKAFVFKGTLYTGNEPAFYCALTSALTMTGESVSALLLVLEALESSRWWEERGWESASTPASAATSALSSVSVSTSASSSVSSPQPFSGSLLPSRVRSSPSEGPVSEVSPPEPPLWSIKGWVEGTGEQYL